jgi:hypothetical protein
MLMPSTQRTTRRPPLPYLPSPPIMPEGVTGALMAAMLQCIASARPASGAEMLRALRDAFPNSSLAARVAAVELITRARCQH